MPEETEHSAIRKHSSVPASGQVAHGRGSGIVTEVQNFGAYIDLGGCEGLITLLELTWSRLQHPHSTTRPD
ncbi:S1 RNA-binding domain-containing protein [Streptomyces sp. AF1A]|uniref:S1 RNA-binding domain-containing protein n=1 Tax=Streptomyces sp. AF1A TaxID=3394350 RepID=UPI0039BD091C